MHRAQPFSLFHVDLRLPRTLWSLLQRIQELRSRWDVGRAGRVFFGVGGGQSELSDGADVEVMRADVDWLPLLHF